MAQSLTLTAQSRGETGKGAARRLRREGHVPAVIYGTGRDPEALLVARPDLEKVLSEVGGSTVVELKIGKKKLQTLVREVQRHPTRLDVIHIDFLEIHAGEKFTVRSPIHLVGSPIGVRTQGGVLDQILRDLEIRVLPKDLPEYIEVDVNELHVGQSLHVRDIVVPNADVLEEPDATVCTVIAPRVEVEVPVAVEEEEELEEPELIRKPKGEEGEAEGTESED